MNEAAQPVQAGVFKQVAGPFGSGATLAIVGAPVDIGPVVPVDLLLRKNGATAKPRSVSRPAQLVARP